MSKLPAGFEDFNSAKTEIFSVKGIGNLKIDATCQVAIVPGDRHEIKVEIDASKQNLSEVDLSQNGDKVSVTQSNAFRGGVITGGTGNVVIQNGNSRTVFSGGVGSIILGDGLIVNNMRGKSVSMINNRVYIDGVEVKPQQAENKRAEGRDHEKEFSGLNSGKNDRREDPLRATRILITTPECCCLNASIGLSGSLISNVLHYDASLELSHAASANVSAQVLKLDTSGSSKFSGNVMKGELEVDASGVSHVVVTGEFAEINADTSGSSVLKTSGPVKGNYNVDASGASCVRHDGRIHGRVYKDQSGCATIQVG